MFGVETQLKAQLRARLQDSWAQLLGLEILPILLKSEDQFAMLFGKTDRPNFSVTRMLDMCFLQKLNRMSDQPALDTFGFDNHNKSDPNQNDDTDKKIKEKKKSRGTTLQSPYDPGATCEHKGRGYGAHITATCNKQDTSDIITDFEVHGAARSDKDKAPSIVNRLASADL